MRSISAFIALALIGLAALTVGCVDEAVNPKIDIKVLDVMTTNLSAGSPRLIAENGTEYVYVKINVTNENDNLDHIFTKEKFRAEDSLRNPFRAESLANLQERENTFTLEPDESRVFYVVFKLPTNVKVTLLVAEMGADEDFTATIPDYQHIV